MQAIAIIASRLQSIAGNPIIRKTQISHEPRYRAQRNLPDEEDKGDLDGRQLDASKQTCHLGHLLARIETPGNHAHSDGPSEAESKPSWPCAPGAAQRAGD